MNSKKRIVIFGATGLIGKELVNLLVSSNYRVEIFTRNFDNAKKDFLSNVKIHMINAELRSILENTYAVINLSGENIAAKPWSNVQKQKILDSRVITSRNIVSALNSLNNKPKVYVQASAIGYYPFSYENTFTENDRPGNSFLSEITEKWENETQMLDGSIRKIIIRTGVVLSNKGGMLPKVITPIRYFIGGILGNGKQWISWIHIDDEVNAIKFLLESESLNGIFNLASPNPLTMKELINKCGAKLHRPTFFTIPSFVIKFLFGQMGEETILGSQKVIPAKLKEAGFKFQFEDMDICLNNLLD
jgi:uncharacterized protein